ncbi:OLC1v1000759C1 [Oldenlandia corymbosa var. corymbosa]|uniref:OLC1v1000759C1 n=1 Tax=Oldenlandia corymbosa var. corymbosa TaxID=529605 RepID=A0AAV1D749_OLDCO|nr:OLC1v1000759C1 [Oldenlandia corymbosa var. corymbosa]
MASATARPSFTFNLSTTPLTQPSLPIRTIKIQSLISKSNSISTALQIPSSKPNFITIPKSLDVSKEDKPTIPSPSLSEEEISSNDSSEATVIEQLEDEEGSTFDKRRLEEKFAVLNTGIYECRSCGYKYDEGAGDPSYPIPPGLPFEKLPDDWRCPTCGASQNFFESKRVEIAGFAQNQQFGLGGNTLTSGQKALLIYGGLGLGFLFFLSGYFLQ